MLIATSLKDVDGTCEASKLHFYGKSYIDSLRSCKAPNRERRSGPEGDDSMLGYSVKVIGTSQQNQVVQPFHLSKDQVCALVHGQALECGIGPRKCLGTTNGITYLTAKDVLRWGKISEWLESVDRTFPAKKGARFRGGDESIIDLLGTFEEDLPDVFVPHDTLVDEVSEFPDSSYTRSFSVFLWNVIALGLPIIYGGIHLIAWDYQFASKTEQLLWKIACFAMMGTRPITWLTRISWDYLYTKTEWVPEPRWPRQWWPLLLPHIFLFVLSRLYIVVEAFISLRHVPIGAYAAVTWVQAIPHV